MDVNAIDLTGADGLRAELETAAAENVKRIVRGNARQPVAPRHLVVPRAEDGLAPDRHMSYFSDLGELERLRIWDGLIGRAVVGAEAALVAIEIDPDTDVPEHQHPNEQTGILTRRLVDVHDRRRDPRAAARRDLGDPGRTFRIPFALARSGASLIELFAPPRDDWAALERLAAGAARLVRRTTA